MQSTLLPYSEEPRAFSVYCNGERVFTNPLFAEYARTLSLSAVAKHGGRVTLLPEWYILRNRFTLRETPFTLLMLIPRPDGDAVLSPEEVESCAMSVTELFRDILSFTDARYTAPEPFSHTELLDAIGLAARAEIDARIEIHASADLHDGQTEADTRGIACAVGLLLEAADGETVEKIVFSLDGTSADRRLALRFLPAWEPNGFLKLLIDCIAEAGGFTVSYTENGVEIPLPLTYKNEYCLRALPKKQIATLYRLLHAVFYGKN